MAGCGVALGQLSYAEMVGLYYLREHIKRERKQELVEAFTAALRNL